MSKLAVCPPAIVSSAARSRHRDALPAGARGSCRRSRSPPPQPREHAWSWTHKYTDLYFVEEARLRACVARRPRGPHLQQDCVQVAIQPNVDDLHSIAGRRALLPQATRARMEPGAPRLLRFGPGLFVHVAEHQHQACFGVLDHGRHQALREIGFHSLTSRPRRASSVLTAAMDTSPK